MKLKNHAEIKDSFSAYKGYKFNLIPEQTILNQYRGVILTNYSLITNTHWTLVHYRP